MITIKQQFLGIILCFLCILNGGGYNVSLWKCCRSNSNLFHFRPSSTVIDETRLWDPIKSVMHHHSHPFFWKCLTIISNIIRERILKTFHFWGSYKFYLHLSLHLVKISLSRVTTAASRVTPVNVCCRAWVIWILSKLVILMVSSP